jgi:hypothetical protein
VLAGEKKLTTASGALAGPNATLPALYSLPAGDYNDITLGNNGQYTMRQTTQANFSCQSGYDCVTGLGTPIANLLIPGLVAYAGPPASPSAPLRGGSGAFRSAAERVNPEIIFEGGIDFLTSSAAGASAQYAGTRLFDRAEGLLATGLAPAPAGGHEAVPDGLWQAGDADMRGTPVADNINSARASRAALSHACAAFGAGSGSIAETGNPGPALLVDVRAAAALIEDWDLYWGAGLGRGPWDGVG